LCVGHRTNSDCCPVWQ